jgi:glycosyltransferase involved in cell wall biosynthesis
LNSPTRILHIATGNLYGGVEVFLRTLARHKAGGGALETAFTVCWEGRLSDELRAAGARVWSLGEVRLSRPWQAWTARLRLQRVLDEFKPAAVILHSAWTHAIFGPVAARQHPVGMMVHTALPRGDRLERWARRIPLAGVVANSKFTSDSAADWYPGFDRPQVIYLPVEKPAVAADKRESVRTGLGANPGEFVILQASRLRPSKGFETLIEALAGLRELGGWRCWLAGGAQTPEEHAFEKRLRERIETAGLAGKVALLGHRSDMPALLAAADAYCQLNDEPEAFGLSFVEAMFASRPVITPHTGGIAEIIDDSCGARLAPKDAEGLRARLRNWIENPALARTLGETARERAESVCNADAQILKLEAWMRGLSAPRQRPR